MNNLELTDQEVRQLHKADPNWRPALERQFGKEFFSQDVTERINGLEDMFREADRPVVENFGDVPVDLIPFMRSVYENVVMAEAYNGCKGMDIYNSDEERHYPYFDCNVSPSSFAFDDSYYDRSSAGAGSGSRLAFKKREHVEHAATKHTGVFRKMLES